MVQKSARQAYHDLARYFGLRQRDAFLSAISPSPANSAGAKPTSKDQFFSEMFGDSTTFKSDEEIFEILKSYGNAKQDVCVTPAKDAAKIPSDVLNKQENDQGWGAHKLTHYAVHTDIIPEKNIDESNVTVYQIFPAARGTDIADTEMVTLFLSNLTTLDMSRAVPYIDIVVSTAVGEGGTDDNGNLIGNHHFSLGRFLGAGKNEMALQGKFLGHIGKSAANVGSDKATNLQAVAGMEIFTTPQTLVNAEDVRYDENAVQQIGRGIDAFRPFLNLEGLDISIVPSGFGTIAYKTAKMNLKLFDRGRLRDIAPLVSPQRKGNVQFYITYGWAHPDGLDTKREGDANGSRMGDLIDAMKIAEAYIVTNSSFSFGTDGVVSIDVDLCMVGTDAASSSDVLSLGGQKSSIDDVMNTLNGIQKKLQDVRGTMPGTDIPQILSRANADSILGMSDEDQKNLRKAATAMKNSGGSLGEAGKALSEMLGANSTKSKIGAAQRQVVTQISEHLDALSKSADPFLRPGKTGVTESELGKSIRKATPSGSKKQKYISFGKLMTNFLAPIFSGKNNDLQLVFSPFNYSAAGVFDYNISQFPIDIADLKKYLAAEAKKKPKMSALDLMQFIEQYFLSFQGNKAYGLDQIYEAKRDEKTHRAKFTKDIRNATKESGKRLTLNNLMHGNLKSIYSNKRVRPTFTPPQVTMNIVTRKNEATGRDITRITFFDAACGQVMPIIDAFNQAARAGHFINESITSDPKVRGARHGEVITATYNELRRRELITSLKTHLTNKDKSIDGLVNEIKGKSGKKQWPAKRTQELTKMLEQTEVFNFENAKSGLKALFFEFAPSLIYGTTASGILSADLSSQQNDALNSIALTSALLGKDGKPVPEDMSLPLMVHPATLKLTTFGCPHFRFAQKYFVDLGTNTSADNFYAITGISHSITKGEYKTAVDMIQTDAYGSFVHVESEIESTIVSIEISKKKGKKK